MSKKHVGLTHSKADELLALLVERAEEVNRDPQFLYVSRLAVFGSYLSDKEELGVSTSPSNCFQSTVARSIRSCVTSSAATRGKAIGSSGSFGRGSRYVVRSNAGITPSVCTSMKSSNGW